MKSTRREWLSACLALAAWPEVISAHQHARAAASSSSHPLETLDEGLAREIETLAAQIIPSSDGPGAREAGVIYFIDRALSTFAADTLEQYRSGMAELQQKRRVLFPSSISIATLTDEQQKSLIRSVEKTDFFGLLRTHTVLGYLGDPSYGGNRGKASWKRIGFDDQVAYVPPFGYYDAPESEEKK